MADQEQAPASFIATTITTNWYADHPELSQGWRIDLERRIIAAVKEDRRRRKPAASTTDLQAIAERNEKRRRCKAPLPARPFMVERDNDSYDDGAQQVEWAWALVSDEPAPGTYLGRVMVADFQEASTSIPVAEAVAFCCNDQPEDDIDQLLAYIADLEAALLEKA